MDSATRSILQGLIVGLVNAGRIELEDLREVFSQIEMAALDTPGEKEADDFIATVRQFHSP